MPFTGSQSDDGTDPRVAGDFHGRDLGILTLLNVTATIWAMVYYQ